MHDRHCECAREDEVESREGQRSSGHEKQKIDCVSIEGDGSSSAVTAHAPSEAILADPRGNCKRRDYDKPSKLLWTKISTAFIVIRTIQSMRSREGVKGGTWRT